LRIVYYMNPYVRPWELQADEILTKTELESNVCGGE